MATHITRSIYLKKAHYNAGNHKGFTPPELHQDLKYFWDKAKSINDLLVSRETLSGTRRKCFIANGSSFNKGFSFQFCSFIEGEFPQSITEDFSSKEIDIAATPIEDEDGNERQVVSVVHVVIYGHVLIVENVRGSGGFGLLEFYLTKLLRTKYQKFPHLYLVDTTNHQLEQEIQRGNGVKSIKFPLIMPDTSSDKKYTKMISEVASNVPNTDKFVAMLESKTSLGTSEVIEMFNEAELHEGEEALGNITIQLNNGESINLKKHKIRKAVQVTSTRGNYPNSNELFTEMRHYLLELMQVDTDGNVVVTIDGKLSSHIKT